MKRTFCVWVLVCAVLAAWPAGADEAGAPGVRLPELEPPSFAALFPKDTALFASIRNWPDFLSKLRELPLIKMVTAKGFLENIMPDEERARLKQGYETYLVPLNDLLQGEVAFGILEMKPGGAGENPPFVLFAVEPGDQMQVTPPFVLFADVAGHEAAMQAYLNETFFPWVDSRGTMQREEMEIAGTPLTRLRLIEDAEDATIVGVKKGVAVGGPATDSFESLLRALDTLPTERLADYPLFVRVEHIMGESDFIEYINIGLFDRQAHAYADEHDELDEYRWSWGAFRAVSGLDPLEVTGLGMSFTAEGCETKVCLLGDKARHGVAEMLSRQPDPLKSLTYVDEDAAVYLAVNVGSLSQVLKDLSGILDRCCVALDLEDGGETTLKRILTPVEAVLGMKIEQDVLPAFGGEVAVAAWIPDRLEIPPAAVLIEVKDAEAVTALVERVLALAKGFGPIEVTRRTVDEIEIVEVNGVPEVTPAVAIVGDFLVVATRASVIEAMLHTRVEGATLGEAKGFKQYVAAIPGEATVLFYLDTPRLFQFGWPLVAEHIFWTDPDEQELAQVFKQFGDALSPFGMKVTGIDGGVLVTSRSANGPLGSISVFGALAIAQFLRFSHAMMEQMGPDEVWIDDDVDGAVFEDVINEEVMEVEEDELAPEEMIY